MRIRCDKETTCFLFPFQIKEDLHGHFSPENVFFLSEYLSLGLILSYTH